MLFRRDTCTPMFIAAVSTIVEVWKEPKHPSTDEWKRRCGKAHLDGSVGWVSDFSSGCDLTVGELDPCVGFCDDSSEPAACFGFCVSLSAPPHSHWARTHKQQDHNRSQSRTLNQLSHPGAPRFHSFWLLSNIPFYLYTTHPLSIHQLMDIWAPSILWLLLILLL